MLAQVFRDEIAWEGERIRKSNLLQKHNIEFTQLTARLEKAVEDQDRLRQKHWKRQRLIAGVHDQFDSMVKDLLKVLTTEQDKSLRVLYSRLGDIHRCFEPTSHLQATQFPSLTGKLAISPD